MKRTEITRDKKIVWTHRDDTKPGIHHFKILDTDEGRRRWRLRRRCGEEEEEKAAGRHTHGYAGHVRG